MNDIAVLPDNELIAVMCNSLYPGAKPESAMMVISYCRAAKLDPMQKPVHIVPMSVKNAQTGRYEFRDVIMPGVGYYRIQADRSGSYAGLSEPEYGEDVTQEFTDKEGNVSSFTFPAWCKITAKKLIGNILVEFTAKEYWTENYASDSRKSTAPNSMWAKRPRGQLAKCTEAQALRKGWPEIGQAPTAEEMEGKVIDMGEAERTPKEPEQTILPGYTDEQFNENLTKWTDLVQNHDKNPETIINMVSTKYTLSDEQKSTIRGIK
ncbi:MAG: phage recombination protein Bet [Candidatus Aminicenantes bacterium]|nr:MAG: phage recombination protein Bet [Candidatus Aminicenantes bacterium]